MDGRYINLATYRRSGVPVETPVWFAEDGGRYYVFSAGNAGKVKRLRNSSRARIAPCDMRGKLLGEWQDAEAVLVDDPAEIARAHSALRQKYGWQMTLTDFLSRLSGRIHQRAFIAVMLQSEDAGDLAAFDDRVREPDLAFEDVVKDLKKRGKI